MKKKECEYTRAALKNYVRGHVFKLQKLRIERHLKSCVVCRSELESLKHVEEARQYIKDITPVEGIMPVLQEGVSAVKGLKRVLYRPLWIVGIVLVAAAVTYYFVTPRRIEVEIENIARTAPSVTAAQPAAVEKAAPRADQAVAARPTAAAASDRAMEPIAITITVPQEHEQEAMQRINDVLREHVRLQKEAFSVTVREISGSLPPAELLAFLRRIGDAGKIHYSRKRFDSVSGAQPVPFILKLKSAAGVASKSSPSIPPVQPPPVEPAAAAPTRPASAPPFAQ